MSYLAKTMTVKQAKMNWTYIVGVISVALTALANPLPQIESGSKSDVSNYVWNIY
jgi:hypothetical protein